ncbi:hypothetical protein BDV96DRAFT_652739 [Lophiotrema nucula]|uniref:Uncharacterized protein n=1 Tax=Lophiotrema nucula TaxID=690887 RepID=A0A6A5YND7_9PLEO|nr:hypothetical protein BDV96DRAFT_652739 [Lophiotrema nucula]
MQSSDTPSSENPAYTAPGPYPVRMSLDGGQQDNVDPSQQDNVDASMLTVSVFGGSTSAADASGNDAVNGEFSTGDVVAYVRPDSERVDINLYKAKMGTKSATEAFGDVDYIIRQVKGQQESLVPSGGELVLRGRNGEAWRFGIEKVAGLSDHCARVLTATTSPPSTIDCSQDEPILLELMARHMNTGSYMEQFEGFPLRLTAAENRMEYGPYGGGSLGMLYIHIQLYMMSVNWKVPSLKKEAFLHVRELLLQEISLDAFVSLAKEIYSNRFNNTMTVNEDIRVAFATYALFYHTGWNSFQNKLYLELFGSGYSFGDYLNKAALASKLIPRMPHHDDKSAVPEKKRKRTTNPGDLGNDTTMNTPSSAHGLTSPGIDTVMKTPSTVRGGAASNSPIDPDRTPTQAQGGTNSF